MKITSSFKILLLMVHILFLNVVYGNDQNKKITVVFRFDDPSGLSSLETESKVIKVFKEYNASLTFGVIPFKCAGSTRNTSPQELIPLGQKRGDILRQAVDKGIIDIALHGYSHQMREAKIWTEFAGLDFKEQKERLVKGKQYLEELLDISINTFIPPYNTYDLNTLKALELSNFTILSAGIHGDVSKDSSLYFIPMTVRLHQVKKAVEKARESLDKEPLIVVMFHEYDFLDVGIEGIDKKIITFKDLENLLGWLDDQSDVQIKTIQQVSEQIKDVTRERYENVKHYVSFNSIIPGFIRQVNSAYPESVSLLKTVFKSLIVYIIILLISLYISYKIACNIVLKNTKTKKTVLFIMSIIIVMVPLNHLISNNQLNARILAAYIFIIGLIIGLLICRIKQKRAKYIS